MPDVAQGRELSGHGAIHLSTAHALGVSERRGAEGAPPPEGEKSNGHGFIHTVASGEGRSDLETGTEKSWYHPNGALVAPRPSDYRVYDHGRETTGHGGIHVRVKTVEEAEASGTPVSDREETRIPRGHGAIHLGTRSAT